MQRVPGVFRISGCTYEVSLCWLSVRGGGGASCESARFSFAVSPSMLGGALVVVMAMSSSIRHLQRCYLISPSVCGGVTIIIMMMIIISTIKIIVIMITL